ncbi:MAG: 4-(cytidine 5'-diphospho)-2-C-methyl-D-erythritol kinase [Actinobacteria bacterium]|nr:4-(cytidine 5'-diphospho)-2-C-methyl-D-erythritol kinase [Actinomycetota bacterium]
MRVRVPAKVNLHLGVGGVRPDGYHELNTVFQAVDLVDEVIAYPARHLEISISGPHADEVPADSRNLAWRAASLLAERAQVAPHVRLEIAKAIPVAGGMAGGSADAAATLVACAELWQTSSSRPELAQLAAELGSDVAFCLLGGTALGTGRGEILAPVLSTGTFWWVLALADYGLSTPAVYAEFDRLNQSSSKGIPQDAAGSPDALFDALRAGDTRGLAQTLNNDLQPAAVSLAPALRRTLAAGGELGALAGIVSGSGPTCAFLTSSQRSATRLAAALTAEDVCRSTRVASGPASGARIVR